MATKVKGKMKVRREPRPMMTLSVESGIDSGQDIGGLRDEIGEWKEKLEGTNLHNSAKYSELEECFDTLDEAADDIERTGSELISKLAGTKWGKDVLAEQCRTYKVRLKSGRSDRLSEACTNITAALDVIANKVDEALDMPLPPIPGDELETIKELVDEMRDYTDGVDGGVSFPGMY
jgi:hypothetical protein